MAKISKPCNYCGEEVERFPSQMTERVYCSRICLNNFKRDNQTTKFECSFCGASNRVRNSSYNKEGNNYCDITCKTEHQKESMKGPGNHFFGRRHSDEVRAKISESRTGVLLGEESPQYNSREIACDECGRKTFKTEYLINRSKNLFCSLSCKHSWMSKNNRGEKSPTWNPLLTDEERERGRKYPEYYDFIKSVMERDSYSCDICGFHSKWGDGLNVHHMNGYNWDIDNRTNVKNGITLCKGCHTDFHKSFGYGNNTEEQYLKYKEENANTVVTS